MAFCTNVALDDRALNYWTIFYANLSIVFQDVKELILWWSIDDSEIAFIELVLLGEHENLSLALFVSLN